MFEILSRSPAFFNQAMHDSLTCALGELKALEGHLRDLPDPPASVARTRSRHLGMMHFWLKDAQDSDQNKQRLVVAVTSALNQARAFERLLESQTYAERYFSLVNQLMRARLQAVQAHLNLAHTHAELREQAQDILEVHHEQ